MTPRGTLRWLGFIALLALLPAAFGQATIQTLLTNGPTNRRINITFFSEGYTTAQLPSFIPNASNALRQILSTPPYNAYSNFFNGYAISVASTNSGSDHYTPSVTLVNTYFNSTFDSYSIQRLLTIPPNDRDGNYANGQGKVDALVASLMPETDIKVLIANDPVYGGSGGSTLVTSMHASSPEIAVHELGHTFVGLGDEYSTAYPGYPNVEEPNTTTNNTRATVKWNPWISAATPVPTPDVTSNYTVVGVFEGAHYQATGWYRPKHDCKMRTLGISFCEVCAQTTVLAIYGLVRPIDSVSPATNTVSVPVFQQFKITPLKPAGGSLNYQWFTNGVAVSSATNTNYTVTASSLGTGTHTVRVIANDPTSFVRTDTRRLLYDTNTWTVTVPAPVGITAQPTNQNARLGTNVTFSVTATGAPPLVYQWRFNATNIAGATNPTLTRTNIQATNAGGYSVVITNVAGPVTSATAILTVILPQAAQLRSVVFSNSQFKFTMTGDTGQKYAIDYSATLTNWTRLTTVTNITGTVQFSDPVSNAPRRFYRALSVP